jgi:hypothetical protein
MAQYSSLSFRTAGVSTDSSITCVLNQVVELAATRVAYIFPLLNNFREWITKPIFTTQFHKRESDG